MNISGAMLVTSTESSWIQEGWINLIDLENCEARGYFYFPSNREVDKNSELILEGVRLNLSLVISSVTFHPQILKYRFIAKGFVATLEEKLVIDPNLTMSQRYFLETDFSSQLEDVDLCETQKPSIRTLVNPIENFVRVRAATLERLLHVEFATPKFGHQ
jgi:hypothetical protein